MMQKMDDVIESKRDLRDVLEDMESSDDFDKLSSSDDSLNDGRMDMTTQSIDPMAVLAAKQPTMRPAKSQLKEDSSDEDFDHDDLSYTVKKMDRVVSKYPGLMGGLSLGNDATFDFAQNAGKA